MVGVPSGQEQSSAPAACSVSYFQQIALTASKVYHQLLEDLEAAHICHNSEMLMLLAVRLESALQSRNAAIAELTNHENACAGEKPAGKRFS
jgi:hypothetical protein